MDYKNTLHLPKTSFPMKANLYSKVEPQVLKFWEDAGILHKHGKPSQRPKYILHDGPPYANGNIHIGHALNKILKDFIIKSKRMSGYDAPYIPGWDCHGLPIEHQVDKKLGKKKETLSKTERRKICRDYAQKFVDIQAEEFKRLGVFGRWEKPYLTMDQTYEAAIVRQFGEFVKKGSVYKGFKPIHWCTTCRTALAEAEVEYADHTSPSITVRFLLEKKPDFLDTEKPVYIPIWTTTPWTLPANMAVALHPDFKYSAVDTGDSVYIVAADLLEAFLEETGLCVENTLGHFPGSRFEHLICRHPFVDRDSKVVSANYVTLDGGTGCVHTAPGHGKEDYETGVKYGLDIYNPVDARGRFIPGMAEGLDCLFVMDANPKIIEILRQNGSLLGSKNISHSYPHCWRCKRPVIFRATSQWFISMEKNDLRKKTLEKIQDVEWIPSWGIDRIVGMMENRPDWCISRQRSWGVPITAFYCSACNTILTDGVVIDYVADKIEAEGIEIWFTSEASDLLPEGVSCKKCGKTHFTKEEDILDVWFDSGSSHAAVLDLEDSHSWPADLYLEGSDQHRGWFHSSILISVGVRGAPPYRAVLTHGFVVDEKGEKMSKSKGNVISPQEIIKKYGSDILRLWVCSEDYRGDIKISEEIIKRLTESYRRIRNTCRYMMGNLLDMQGFNPAKDSVPYAEMEELDKYALHTLSVLHEKVTKAYDSFEFHTIYHSIHNFCNLELSSFYLDILKDRLYTAKKDSRKRYSALTVMWEILHSLLCLMAPVLSFTAEEVWQRIRQNLPELSESVLLGEFPAPKPEWNNPELAQKWERLIEIRGCVAKVLEGARREKIIGLSLDAKVTLFVSAELESFLKSFSYPLQKVFIVSQLEIIAAKPPGDAVACEGISELFVSISQADGKKCARCWVYSETVGENAEHAQICGSCVSAISPDIGN